mmetsp:Transcript_1073/g.4779  ORF Transcript_1073/g.4779 Transcript_1073/m.4779 type:complete len:314 (-) Transcript_1073:838-1779(-)
MLASRDEFMDLATGRGASAPSRQCSAVSTAPAAPRRSAVASSTLAMVTRRSSAAALWSSSADESGLDIATAVSPAPCDVSSSAQSGASLDMRRSACACRSLSCCPAHRDPAPSTAAVAPVSGCTKVSRHAMNSPRANSAPASSSASSARSSHASRFISKSCADVVFASGCTTPSTRRFNPTAEDAPSSGCVAACRAVSPKPATLKDALALPSCASMRAVMSSSFLSSLSVFLCPSRSVAPTSPVNAEQNPLDPVPVAAANSADPSPPPRTLSRTFHMSSDVWNTMGERKSVLSNGASPEKRPPSARARAFSAE